MQFYLANRGLQVGGGRPMRRRSLIAATAFLVFAGQCPGVPGIRLQLEDEVMSEAEGEAAVDARAAVGGSGQEGVHYIAGVPIYGARHVYPELLKLGAGASTSAGAFSAAEPSSVLEDVAMPPRTHKKGPTEQHSSKGDSGAMSEKMDGGPVTQENEVDKSAEESLYIEFKSDCPNTTIISICCDQGNGDCIDPLTSAMKRNTPRIGCKRKIPLQKLEEFIEGNPGCLEAAERNQVVNLPVGQYEGVDPAFLHWLPWIGQPESEEVSHHPEYFNAIGASDGERVATGEGVDIWVVDTGVRKTHEEFGGDSSRVIPMLDLRYPVNLSHNFDNSQSDPLDAEAEYNYRLAECNDELELCATDWHWHGTHVASIAAGETLGVAPKARILAVRLFTVRHRGTHMGGAEIGDVHKVLGWILSHHNNLASPRKAVINLSIEVPHTSELLTTHIDDLIKAGIAVVVAAGNKGEDCNQWYPAKVSSALTVGAVTWTSQPNLAQDAFVRATYSNWGSCVDLYAIGDVPGATSWNNQESHFAEGTSQAAPQVSGALALLWNEFPDGSGLTYSLEDVTTILMNRAQKRNTGTPYTYSGPHGNAGKLLWVGREYGNRCHFKTANENIEQTPPNYGTHLVAAHGPWGESDSKVCRCRDSQCKHVPQLHRRRGDGLSSRPFGRRRIDTCTENHKFLETCSTCWCQSQA